MSMQTLFRSESAQYTEGSTSVPYIMLLQDIPLNQFQSIIPGIISIQPQQWVENHNDLTGWIPIGEAATYVPSIDGWVGLFAGTGDEVIEGEVIIHKGKMLSVLLSEDNLLTGDEFYAVINSPWINIGTEEEEIWYVQQIFVNSVISSPIPEGWVQRLRPCNLGPDSPDIEDLEIGVMIED